MALRKAKGIAQARAIDVPSSDWNAGRSCRFLAIRRRAWWTVRHSLRRI